MELGAGTGKNLRYYPDDREIVATDISDKMLERARRKAAHSDLRVRFERAGPNGRILEVTISPLPDGRQIRTFTDVTERRRTERALARYMRRLERSNRDLEEFAHAASHAVVCGVDTSKNVSGDDGVGAQALLSAGSSSTTRRAGSSARSPASAASTCGAESTGRCSSS